MPIYEYLCTDCSHELEALQKMSDDPLKFCPECGEETLKKKISASAFVLKGTGWYETDFKNNGKTSSAADNKSSANSDSKASSKDGETTKSASSKSDNSPSKSSKGPSQAA